MADIAERMKSLRGVARADAPPAAVPEMDQFRADFKLVWQWRLRSGWFSQEEFGRSTTTPAGQCATTAAIRSGWRAPSETSRSRPPTSGPALRGRRESARSAPRESELRQIS